MPVGPFGKEGSLFAEREGMAVTEVATLGKQKGRHAIAIPFFVCLPEARPSPVQTPARGIHLHLSSLRPLCLPKTTNQAEEGGQTNS